MSKPESNNTMPLNAVEIRLTRLLPSGEIREYEAVTWDRPFESCWRWLNHANAVGFIAKRGEEYGQAEVLDSIGDVIAEYPLTDKGFKFWKNKWRCKVIKGELV